MNFTKQKGFTLIELLVVLAIIGLLASVVMTGLGTARRGARDAQRVSNMRVVRDALNLYYQDNGVYPTSVGWQGTSCGANYINGLTSYLPRLPRDPRCGTSTCLGATSRDYLYQSNGTDYKLIIDGCFETSKYTGAGQPFADPVRLPFNGAFGAVYSPGGANW